MKSNWNYCVLDLETGGFEFKKHAITEIAYVILNENMEIIHERSMYIKPNYNPNREYIDSALNYTNITLDKLESEGIEAKETYKIMVSDFKKFKLSYNKVILVGQNFAEFDKDFLEDFFNQFEAPTEKQNFSLYKHVSKHIEDTMFYSRKKWGGVEVENHKLDGICERLGVQLTNAHKAINDVKATAECFKYFYNEIRNNNGNIIVNQNSVQETTVIKYVREFEI